MAEVARWGTWEELVLGGAVLRHGTAAWDVVAAEVRARTPCPAPFTPQACEAKYEDLQQHYSGSDALFEELRKRRIAELKIALEKSEDSIGSLQSKLESLNAERASGNNSVYDTSQAELTSPSGNAGGIYSSSRGISKDGSCAGSFTEETDRNWSSCCQFQPSASAQGQDLKMEVSEVSVKDKTWTRFLGIVPEWFKKKRGKRKRKACNVVAEGSAGDNDTSSSFIHIGREGPSDGCDRKARQSNEECHRGVQCEDGKVDLAEILDSIIKHNDTLVFRCRLEDQKRSRHKKLIHQHLDLQGISSRISDGSISSTKELSRDLLLLANNVLAFCAKDSLEYKSALTIRDIVTKTLRQGCEHSTMGSGVDGAPLSTQMGKPIKLTAMGSCNQNNSRCIGVRTAMVRSHADTPAVSSDRKRGTRRPMNGEKGSGGRQHESPSKGRKRSRGR